MDSRRWHEIKSVFDTIVEMDDVERGTRLSALSTSDPELHAAVELLLAADSDADARLASLDAVFFAQSAPASDPLGLTGRTISHFQVREPLGAGGMGVVYRAEDERLGRAVALKFLLPFYSLDASARARLQREAHLVAALDHANLCTIHEVGTSEDGGIFLAMPLYPGETLKARLTRAGPTPIGDVLEIARQVTAGLECAHNAGIVHRDLKPGNIMLLPDGTVKILDFGLAKARDQSLSEPGMRFGTVSYMSPEQIRGEAVDARADLWAVGVVLYEMLAQRKPFGGEQDISIAHAILHDEPAPPSMNRNDVSEVLEDLVLRLLQKYPSKRYATALELLGELARIDTAAPARTRRRRAWPRRPVILVATIGSDGVWRCGRCCRGDRCRIDSRSQTCPADAAGPGSADVHWKCHCPIALSRRNPLGLCRKAVRLRRRLHLSTGHPGHRWPQPQGTHPERRKLFQNIVDS